MTDEILRTVAERTKAAKIEPGGRSREDGGAATASGKHCVALGAGPLAIGMVTESNLLVLVERDPDTGAILHHFSAMCGTKSVKPGVYYRLSGGKLERVS